MGHSFQPKNHKKRQAMSDINITPFVDVLLVLLIIFMVAAPMMTSNINVDLPKGVSNPDNQKVLTIVVSIKEDGAVFLQDEPVKLGHLPEFLLKVTNGDLSSRISVRADKSLDYGRVMDVVNKINLTGFSQVALVVNVKE